MGETKNEAVRNLLSAICSIDNIGDAKEFLEDLCTAKEINDMAQRFDTAIKLYNGANYLNVSSESGISSATISRVNKCVKKNGGYVKAIKKLGLGK
ncbi:MAG: DNA-binding transcriptional regulator [Clostridia bacterium]|nr:DNA-binding transcriptional regulator [Clostridia bacterium]